MRKRNKISERKPSRGVDLFRFLIYILPGVLFFSYWPVMTLGASESMNLELSLPLIWLVVFDVLVIVMMAWRKLLFKGWRRKWMWLLLPAWLTISVLWSVNFWRGVLTVGIVWLLYLAVDGVWSLRGLMSERGVREKFWKWFFGAALVACGWCWLQCILDLVGVSHDYTLMCAGCGYEIFGFPHPNGWAAEPQFMGNLLIAPMTVAGWRMLRLRPRPAGPFASDVPSSAIRVPRGERPQAAGAKSRAAALRNAASLKHFAIFFTLSATLFLTMSRGAIYAAVVGLVVMTVWTGVRQKSWRVLQVWGVVVVAFVGALGAQGVMAEVSRTNDTFVSGVSKVVNQLTLGVVDLGGGQVKKEAEAPVVEEAVGGTAEEVAMEEESGGKVEEAHFDGYAEISTRERTHSWEGALAIWSSDVKMMLGGVGLGGATMAMYVNGYRDTPREIVNNEYISLLLETGVVGVALVGFSLVLAVRAMWKSPLKVVLLSLLVAYGVSLCFFSGLPNALQIYLLPAVIMVMSRTKIQGQK